LSVLVAHWHTSMCVDINLFLLRKLFCSSLISARLIMVKIINHSAVLAICCQYFAATCVPQTSRRAKNYKYYCLLL